MDNSEVTVLLQAWRAGDPTALERVTPFLYQELRRVALSYLRGERADHTLTPTALINETYLRFLEQNQPQWKDRKHFLGIAARLMRQILVDFARRKRAGKRGFGVPEVPLEDAEKVHVGAGASFGAADLAGTDLVDLDEALLRLERVSPRQSQAIEMRYFAELTVDEIADLMEVSPATISRELRMAQAWLGRELSPAKSRLKSFAVAS
jgi:RNA polymerase sigma factor (TIGR02999 family)